MGRTRNDPNTFKQLRDADWNAIGRKLVALVVWRTGSGSLPKGVTAEDIAQSVIEKTLNGTRRWDPDKGDLLPWLFDQVRSEVSNLMESAGAQSEALLPVADDVDTEEELQGQMEFQAFEDGVFSEAKPKTPEAILISQETIDDRVNVLFEAIGNSGDLLKLYEAMTELDEVKPQILAEKLKVDVREIYNQLRQLRRRIAQIRTTKRD